MGEERPGRSARHAHHQVRTTKYVANETPAENRQPILDAYKLKAGKIVEAFFRKLPDPADHPVFTLTPGT